MKLSFLFLALVSFPVLACPNLAGTYKVCRSSTELNTISDITVEQKIVNKFYQYTFTIRETDGREVRIEKYTADGKTKVVTDSDSGITFRTETLTTCQDNVLNIKMNATLDSEVFANVAIKVTKDGNQLTQVFSGVSMDEPVNDTIFCE